MSPSVSLLLRLAAAKAHDFGDYGGRIRGLTFMRQILGDIQNHKEIEAYDGRIACNMLRSTRNTDIFTKEECIKIALAAGDYQFHSEILKAMGDLNASVSVTRAHLTSPDQCNQTMNMRASEGERGSSRELNVASAEGKGESTPCLAREYIRENGLNRLSEDEISADTCQENGFPGGGRGSLRVEVVDGDSVEGREFVTKYVNVHHPKPVLVKNAARNWPAMKAWKWSLLNTSFQHAMTAENCALQSMHHSSCGRKGVYLSQIPFWVDPEIDSHVSIDEWFPPDLTEDVMQEFGIGLESSFQKFIIISQTGGGGELHKDAMDTGFWNVLISGEKRWWLTPNWNPQMEHSMGEAMDLSRQFKLSAMDWFSQVYPKISKKCLPVPVYEVLQQAGDLLYVPAGGYFHQVLTTKRAVGVTYNMLTKNDYTKVFSGACRYTQYSKHVSVRMCNTLRHVRPAWYKESCCLKFVKSLMVDEATQDLEDPTADLDFPVASSLQESQFFAPLALPRHL
mmetsp:Transcript_32308/g.52056  ORF Transcript_32308/g.52056 Transcript_32308/m.52056 type:complete len:509 (-) Transcript_32308:78-1604(-)